LDGAGGRDIAAEPPGAAGSPAGREFFALGGAGMIPTLILNALAVSSLYIMMASGLALIFGLRRVMNFVHGAIYMVGDYQSYTIASGMNLWAALVIVPLLMSVLGVLLELEVRRPLERRQQIEVALITFGIGIVIAQIVIRIYGGTPLS